MATAFCIVGPNHHAAPSARHSPAHASRQTLGHAQPQPLRHQARDVPAYGRVGLRVPARGLSPGAEGQDPLRQHRRATGDGRRAWGLTAHLKVGLGRQPRHLFTVLVWRRELAPAPALWLPTLGRYRCSLLTDSRYHHDGLRGLRPSLHQTAAAAGWLPPDCQPRRWVRRQRRGPARWRAAGPPPVPRRALR